MFFNSKNKGNKNLYLQTLMLQNAIKLPALKKIFINHLQPFAKTASYNQKNGQKAFLMNLNYYLI